MGRIHRFPRYIGDMWRFLIRLLQLPLALIVMFYEWGWETLAHLFDWLARRPLWKNLRTPFDGCRRGRIAGIHLAQRVAVPGEASRALADRPRAARARRNSHSSGENSRDRCRRAALHAYTAGANASGWFATAYRWFIPWKDAWLNAIRASWPWRVGRVIKFSRQTRPCGGLARRVVRSVRSIFGRT